TGRRDRDALLVGHVEIGRIPVDRVASVPLDPDSSGGLPVLVERQTPGVGRQAEGKGSERQRRERRRQRQTWTGNDVAAEQLRELHSEEWPARGVPNQGRKMLLDDVAGGPSRERVALRAEERGGAALRQRGQHRRVELKSRR